jgi:formate hydrogenlyase subunit 3/multisubunit Na+/H+ antiporter MnhD subunit
VSTAHIWIIIPALTGMLLLFFPKRRKFTAAFASLLSLLLAFLAFSFPSEHVFVLAGRRYEFATSIELLGRSLTINKDMLTLVALIYSFSFLWNAFSFQFKVSGYFNALSLVITALWTAVPAFEPFLYASVLVQLVVLISVPLLSPRGQAAGPGLLRYLVLQSLAMPFILLSGWMLSGIATAPSANPLIVRAALMIIVGFALWLAVFPLHTWMAMLAQESHPWVLSFLLTLRQTVLLVYLISFFDRYAWLRGMPAIDQSLQILGVAMIAVAGLLTAIQSDLRRVFSYLFMSETGYALLTLGLIRQGALPLIALSMVPRAALYWLWGYTHSVARDHAGIKTGVLQAFEGLLHTHPFLSLAWFISLLGISGMPLLAYFPVKRLVWLQISSLSVALKIGMVIGVGGVALFSLRFLKVLIMPVEQDPPYNPETLRLKITLVVLLLILLLMGIFPHFFLNHFQNLLLPFEQLLTINILSN